MQRAFFPVIAAALLALAAHSRAGGMPADFRVTAEYNTGDVLSDGQIVSVSVAADGTLERSVWPFGEPKPTVTRHQIPRSEVERVFDAVQHAKFFEFPTEYLSPDVRDCPPDTLTVVAGGKAHKVVYQPCMRTEPRAKQFDAMWQDILRIIAPEHVRA